MGLFSDKKTIVVSSTVYNMAGDQEERNNFLKASLFSASISDRNPYIGETIVGNHLKGPGIRQRQFFNWAKLNDYAGLPTFSIRSSYLVDPIVVQGQIPIPASPVGLENVVQTAYVTDGDFTYFAEQWILENDPEKINTEYASDYDEEEHEITIQFEDGSTAIIDAGVYDSNKQFIVSNFYQQLPSSVHALEVGTLVVDQDIEDLPDSTGFTQTSLTNTGINSYTLNYTKTVTKTYSDSTPQEGPTVTSEVDSIDFNGTEEVSSMSEFLGAPNGGIQTVDLQTTHYVFERRHIVNRVSTVVEVNDLGGGVTETVTTELDGDHLDPIYDYRIDTQETVNSEVIGGEQIFIYEMGSGNIVLDAMESTQTSADTAEFFPYIPIRINNKSITNSKYDDENGNGLYKECVTAYRRASGGQSFASLVDEVEDNDDLDEIDYACVTFGVSLNTEEPSCRKYLYKFFELLIPYQNTTGAYMDTFKAGVLNYEEAKEDYDDWVTAQTAGSSLLNPLYGTDAPDVPSLAQPETTTITIKSDSSSTSSFDNRLTWVSIDEELFTGLGKSGAVKGDIWFEKGQDFTWTENIGLSRENNIPIRIDSNTIEQTFLYWQTGDNTYKRLTIHGLLHRNYVYDGKHVHTSANEALDDDDESGFIVPLHNPTIRSMNIVDYTQMATANTFLVFNSYKVYKKKWYETFLGMLLIIVLVVVASVLFAPSVAASSGGILGGNVAVGSSLGLSGTAGLIAGAVANAIAGVLIAQVVSNVTSGVFGEKWGAIIGSIVTFAIGFAASGGFNNFDLSTALSPKNLLSLSSALANGYSGYIQADIAEMNNELLEMGEEYSQRIEDINDMIRDLGGANDLSFDPMQLTDVHAGNGSSGTGSYVPESLDEFIHRTTLTGSDIVEVTLSMVENYAELNLQPPRN